MPLSPQDVADQLNANGIDTPEKFGSFISFAAVLTRRNELGFAIQKAQADRQAAIQEADARIAELVAEVAELDRAQTGR